MWFRNLQIYRLGDDWKWDAARLSEKLAQSGFQACGAFDMQSRGWVPPRGEEGELLVAVNRQWLIALGVEQKLLPAAVIRQYTQARVAELEAKQGFKAGRAQARDLREQVTAELLPRAFVTAPAWSTSGSTPSTAGWSSMPPVRPRPRRCLNT